MDSGNALLHRFQLWQLLTALLTLPGRADLPLLLMNTINCHSGSEQSMVRRMTAPCYFCHGSTIYHGSTHYFLLTRRVA